MLSRQEENGKWQFSLRALFATTTVCAIVLSGIVTSCWIDGADWRAGHSAAERQWKDRRAVLHVIIDGIPTYYDYNKDGYSFEHFIDRETGLFIAEVYQQSLSDSERGYYEGYNARVRELVQSEGRPPWSVAQYAVCDDELVEWFHAADMQRIPQFPYRTTTGFVLGRDDLPNRVLHQDREPELHIGYARNHPGIIFLRVDDQYVAALDTDGRCLSIVTRW